MTTYTIIHRAIEAVASTDTLTQIAASEVDLMTEVIMENLLDAGRLVPET